MLDNVTYMDYSSLRSIRLKAFRNGNLRRLDRVEKDLYGCALYLAKMRYKICNPKLLGKLVEIARRLMVTRKV